MNGGTVLGGAFIVAGLFHGYLVIRLWRNPATAARLVDNFSSVFPYSDEFCRGMVRASAATTGGVTTAGLFAVIGQAAMAHQAGTLGRDLLDAMIASLVALFLFIALNMSLTLFNFPKRLAPPHMRDDLGSVIAHRRDRAARRRAAG
ncbi:hypothetical protein OHQ89_51515 [Streptomyces canus]|uniref:hypothetical protein n=1 Tax=Streptomyces canus TaxID=58343 RepID=UPI0030DE7F06